MQYMYKDLFCPADIVFKFVRYLKTPIYRLLWANETSMMMIHDECIISLSLT